VSQVGIAGSTEIGQGVILAGQVGVAGHLKIGNGVKVAAQSGIHKNIRDGEVISGSPPMPFKVWVKMAATLPRLPEMRRKIKKLEDELRKMEKRLKNTSPEDAHD
jgi:UDP-3-O-[3-hydroxymyristoyl] glucosamine N-acyltransferase